MQAVEITVEKSQSSPPSTVPVVNLGDQRRAARLERVATIAKRRRVPAEPQRLVVGDAALDDANALLSSCGVVDGTEGKRESCGDCLCRASSPPSS